MPKIVNRNCPTDMCAGVLVTRIDTDKEVFYKRCTKCDHRQDEKPMNFEGKTFFALQYKNKPLKG